MKVDIEELADAIDEGMPSSDDDRRLMRRLYEMLAAGSAVEIDVLARRASLEPDAVRRTLDGWPNVFRDEQGRIVGFGGL